MPVRPMAARRRREGRGSMVSDDRNDGDGGDCGDGDDCGDGGDGGLE